MPLVDEIAREELSRIDALGLRRSLEPLRSPPGPVIEIGSERLVNFSSNDYLGLAGDPRLGEALADGAHRYGAGAGASRLVSGDYDVQHELEAELAAFEGAEAALLFNSGYAANGALLPALAAPGDLIVSDALNHASIVDGCRLSRARIEVVGHRDVDAVGRALGHPARRKFVVVDSVFSMDGDRAPLLELREVCDRHAAVLLVDEAHATGVLGPRGVGLAQGLADVRMATLSKAFGVAGAYVAASRAVRDLLVNRARTLIFSTALPPALACAARAALRILSGPEGDQLRARLATLGARLAAGLRGLGFEGRTESVIFPVVLGTPERAMQAAAALRARGFLVKGIRPPTVPEGTSRLRIAVTAAHTEGHVDGLLSALREAV